MFNSNNVEELIYTFFKFDKAAKDLEMKGKDMQKHFLKLLGQDARSRYDDMMEEREETIADWEFEKSADGFIAMKKEFLKCYVKDEDARGTMLRSLNSGDFKKPLKTTIAKHRERFVWILYCIEYLEGGKLSKTERKRLYFESYPITWQTKYQLSGNRFSDAKIDDINE